MEDMRIRLLDGDGKETEGRIRVSRREPWHIVFDDARDGETKFRGEDLFNCMVAMRTHLESRGRQLLCAGARKDVYPSPMGRSMGAGRQAYILPPGKQATETIDIFAPAEAGMVGTVAEQRQYYEKWREDLG